MSNELTVYTAEARPDLWRQSVRAFTGLWPEYNLHGDVAGEYFGALFTRFARFQVLVCDAESGELVGRGRTIPFAWDRTRHDLPAGVDALGLAALRADRPANALSALSA